MPSRIAFLKPACRYAYDWQIETGKDFIEFVGECVNGLSTQVFSMKVKKKVKFYNKNLVNFMVLFYFSIGLFGSGRNSER